MDGARLSRFPHLSWLRFRLDVPADGRRLSLRMRGVVCGLSIAVRGSRSAKWITRCREVSWTEGMGAVTFIPADGDEHTYTMTSDTGCDLFVALIPPGHLSEVTAAEGIAGSGEWSPLLASTDAVLQGCMARLAAASTSADAATDVEVDELARRLVMRMASLTGHATPDWHDDTSVFDRRTLRNLVCHMDEHLHMPPALGDLATLVGLSPSHFARRFRYSTGLSLYRFINRRRILRALEMLQTDSPIVAVALDLGFSSQSHFTRLFSSLTGMTPANYRRQFGRQGCCRGLAVAPSEEDPAPQRRCTT